MKYSLMTHMIDKEIKLKKPTFIHLLIMKHMGYEGPEPTLEEALEFLRSHGMEAENGTMTFRDCVKFAKDHGYEGIDAMSHHFEEEPEDAKAALEEFGITLSAIDIIEPFSESANEEEFQAHLAKVKSVIDRGAAAGCRNFMVMPTQYPVAIGNTREQMFQLMARGLRECVAYGKEKGVVICTETLENSGVPLGSIGEMLRLFQEVPGLCYAHDTGNPLAANEDPLATYEVLKDRVSTVHFKDLKYTEEKTDIYDPLGRHLEMAVPGTGLVDFAGHLRALQRDGYEGYITLEGHFPADNQLDGVLGTLEYFKKLEQTL